ncbi:putative ribonuclease H-like domain-containing protein [Tanacetum coccineum]
MGKMYYLVVTDDYSRFSWVFFLSKKDKTSGILKNFITSIENQLNHKVKTIIYDNRTEFKNYEMNQLCGIKGIKREFSNVRTPQQNGVAKRKNRTLKETARTMLADSLLPIPFWAEAVNIACYVQNMVKENGVNALKENGSQLHDEILVLRMKENEVNALKENGSQLHDEILHEHQIKSSVKMQSQDIQINPVQAMDDSLIVSKGSLIEPENNDAFS